MIEKLKAALEALEAEQPWHAMEDLRSVIAEMEAGELVAILSEALAALEVAQDNLRPHGDNCFLHDNGEYASCFCGKDSVSSYLQNVVEKLATAIDTHPQPKAEPAQPKQEPVEFKHVCNLWIDPVSRDYIIDRCDHPPGECIPAYIKTSPHPQPKAEPDRPVEANKTMDGPVHEPVKLWLWKNFVNGVPEYWAFDNAFPVGVDHSDPLTLGEPCGYALLKESRKGRNDIADNEVLRRVVAAEPQAKPLTDAQPKNPLSVLQIRDIRDIFDKDEPISLVAFARAIEAAHGIK